MRTITATLTSLVLAAALVGCSTGEEGSDAASGPSSTAAPSVGTTPAGANETDLHFLGMMTPHHDQAVEMSEIILSADGVTEQTRDLAQRILDGQKTEIVTMRSLAADWGIDDVMAGHSEHVANGMLSAQQMTALSDLAAKGSAAESERLFLELMWSHHAGAIAMTQGQVDDGGYPDLQTLAQQMIDVQTAEMAEIDVLLGS